MGVLYTQEKEYLDEGLPLFTERSSDGMLRNRTYDFPYSYYKAMGRVIAHAARDGEVPMPVYPAVQRHVWLRSVDTSAWRLC